MYGIDCAFKLSGMGVITYGKILYNLRVVVCVPAGSVSIVTRSRPFISGEFHDGELDSLVFIRDFRVLGCGAVNKVIDSTFQSGYALCAIAHSLIHTAGGIQHHDNVQSLCIGGGGRRIGGQRRQCDQEISAFLFGHCDRGIARQVDLFILHRFIGPNTACGGVVISLRMHPRVKRVGIAYSNSVRAGCYLCIIITPPEHMRGQGSTL